MRRILIASAALALASLAATAPAGADPAAEPGAFPFGVGSNDVTHAAASLWTQTTAQQLTAMWSTDPTFASGVRRRRVEVSPDHARTVLVRIGGLPPDTVHHFKFVDPQTQAESRVGPSAPPRGPPA